MHPVYHANERLTVNSTSPGATGFPYISPISRHGHTDKGRVERGIERELYFTGSHRISIHFSYILPCRLNRLRSGKGIESSRHPISRHGHTDKGRIERGIERELLSTQLYRIIQGFHKR